MTTTAMTGAGARPPAPWRRRGRALRLAVHLAYGLALAGLTAAWLRPHRPVVRALARHWLRVLLGILRVRVEVRGEPAPGARLVVANHVSWLDIPVIGAVDRVCFLSKAEVRDWPVIGALATAAGTLFIRRGSGESGRKATELADHLRRGRAVVVFPEGTTTDGLGMKRFHHRLFNASPLSGAAVQPVAIRYLSEEGDVETGVAFIGDDEFTAHLWKLLARPVIRVQVTWLEPLRDPLSAESLCQASRDAIARELALSHSP